MLDIEAALLHHFFELAVAYRIRHIPADAPRDHVTLKMAALEIDHCDILPALLPAIIGRTATQQKYATKP